MHLSPPVALAAVLSKAYVLLLLVAIVAPLVRFCDCSVFCCALLCVHSSFAVISMGKRELDGCFVLFVFLVSRDCCVALPHDVTGLSAVCDCGIS